MANLCIFRSVHFFQTLVTTLKIIARFVTLESFIVFGTAGRIIEI